MYRFQITLLAILGTACFACKVVVPQPPQLTIALDAKARVKVPSPPKVEVDVGVGVEANAEVAAVEVAPPAPTIPVAIRGAAIVEFFGIPLEGAQDIVFVLDRSGSMANFARGQLAQLTSPQLVGEPGGAPAPEAQPLLPPDAAPPLGPLEGEPPAPPLAGEALGEPPAPPLAGEPPQDLNPAEEIPPPPPRPRKIDVAHAELVDALERLPAGTRMNLLFFNNRLEASQAQITPLREDDRESVIGFVLGTFPDGTTALAPAMRTAFLMRAKRIVLLSDGLGNVGGDAEAVLRDAREAMRGGVRIDTIGLGLDQDVWLLRALAQESGGIYQQL